MTLELIANVIGTLAAAFAGAFFAFKFEKSQRDTERVDNEVAAGNRALFTLSTMWNTLKQYQKEVVDKHRDKFDAWLNLSTSLPIDDADRYFDTKDLSFLLQTKAATFQSVSLEGIRFRFAASLIAERRKLVLSEGFPRLSDAGIQMGEGRPQEEMERILGPGIVQQLKLLSSGIIQNVDEDVTSLRSAFVNLRAALKAIHPEKKFIDLPTET